MSSKLVQAAVAASITLAIAACADPAEPAATAPVTATTTASAEPSPTTAPVPKPLIAEPAPLSAWTVVEDAPSGFSAALPEQVPVDTSQPEQRTYAVELSEDAVADLTVAFTDASVAPARLEGLVRARPDAIKAKGATDVQLTDVTPVVHAGQFAAYDFTITYTAQGAKFVMWSRYIAAPKAFIAVVTESSGAALDPGPSAVLKTYHQRACDSVKAR